MAVGKDKSRKHLSISQWAKKNKDLLNSVTFQEPHTEDKKWRSRREYRRWRDAVLKRDGFTCVLCGSNKQPTAHHVIPAAVAPEIRFQIWNGWCLCRRCHESKSEFLHRMSPQFWLRLLRG